MAPAAPPFHIDWIPVPAGQVTLADGKGEYSVAPFRIAKYAVTNAEFDAFIADDGYTDPRWWADVDAPALTPEQLEMGMSDWRAARERIAAPKPSHWPEPDCPRTDVTWYEAMAFCRWLSARLNIPVRLPTEWEWQWAAVGDTGWAYPFGPAFDATKCNTHENGIGRTVPVTAYSGIHTVFGVVNLSGNTIEWCANEFENPPNILVAGTGRPAMRGGARGHDAANARASHRFGFNALNSSYAVGFRVVTDAELR
ncbi:MAG: SUMF1/EgtB/PvdO family nonheme iron enzyme [Phototrophicaceae bacterium]